MIRLTCDRCRCCTCRRIIRRLYLQFRQICDLLSWLCRDHLHNRNDRIPCILKCILFQFYYGSCKVNCRDLECRFSCSCKCIFTRELHSNYWTGFIAIGLICHSYIIRFSFCQKLSVLCHCYNRCYFLSTIIFQIWCTNLNGTVINICSVPCDLKVIGLSSCEIACTCYINLRFCGFILIVIISNCVIGSFYKGVIAEFQSDLWRNCLSVIPHHFSGIFGGTTINRCFLDREISWCQITISVFTCYRCCSCSRLRIICILNCIILWIQCLAI